MQEKNYTKTYFFDSYAIIELLKGGENYKKYITSGIITTELNLFEVTYNLQKISEQSAKEFLENFYKFKTEYGLIIILRASTMKLNNKNLSMADCIGYCLAKYLEIPFLTGDKEFENLDNVEFVK